MGNLSKRGKLVAFYEMAAGLVGVAAAVPPLFRPAPSGHETGYYVTGIGLVLAAAVSFIAGLKLLQKKDAGLKLSYLIQIIQLPELMVRGLHFHIFLLACVSVGVNGAKEFFLNYFAGARMVLAVGPVGFEFAGVNVLALLVIFLLKGAYRKE